eukprot:TRINITY_DN10671_c1_g1_i1.p1 TRINITY_DN10671_c1_g1~~TRINITY_DN10671_c1_g1_i1.p1  ORF type:complete len:599 (+),score=142.69 TRINITY_DN10671_c1_g1_i1:97-1797(+)
MSRDGLSAGAPDFPPPPPPRGGTPPSTPNSGPLAAPGPYASSAAASSSVQASAAVGASNSWGSPAAYPPAFNPRGIVTRPMSEDFENSGWKDKRLWSPAGPSQGPGASSQRQQRQTSSSDAVSKVSDLAAPSEQDARLPRRSPASAAPAASIGGDRSGGSSSGPAGPRSRLRAEGASSSADPAVSTASVSLSALRAAVRPPERGTRPSEVFDRDADDSEDGSSEPSRLPRERRERKPRAPVQSSLEALDPESSSDSEESGSESEDDDVPEPGEHVVLNLTVPRTALVINVSHVLKRLHGCCSLNQLTKSTKMFKEKTGVSLEAFLRAEPMSFKLEGRIVYLLDRDGERWKPPQGAKGDGEYGKGNGRGKGEASGKGSSSGESGQKGRGGKGSGTETGSKGGKKGKDRDSGEAKGKGGKKGKDAESGEGGSKGGKNGKDGGKGKNDDKGGKSKGGKGKGKGKGSSERQVAHWDELDEWDEWDEWDLWEIWDDRGGKDRSKKREVDDWDDRGGGNWNSSSWDGWTGEDGQWGSSGWDDGWKQSKQSKSSSSWEDWNGGNEWKDDDYSW